MLNLFKQFTEIDFVNTFRSFSGVFVVIPFSKKSSDTFKSVIKDIMFFIIFRRIFIDKFNDFFFIIDSDIFDNFFFNDTSVLGFSFSSGRLACGIGVGVSGAARGAR